MMEDELEKAKAEIERLKCSLDDKDYIIKSQWDETETLKALVSELQKKSLEAEKNVKSPKNNQCQGGDLLEDLVDRQRKVEDELKWKVEQFKHLEEAHEKLRDQFRASKTEWDTEKFLLVDEISKLQEVLDDGIQTAEGLKSQLAMCKQALENEESRRKRLEEEVSEMKLLLESASQEGFERKSEGECLAAEGGEEEIANLRHSLRVKEMDYKDMEYKARKLERENQELLTSIRELQEAHIPRAVPTPSSWAKLKTRLKSLEQSHKECSANLRAKEVEWSSKADRMSQELKRCSSNLEVKNQVIEELNKELEGCNSSLTQLKMQNEELSLMLQLMRSEDSEDREGGVAQLMEQLEKERQEKHGMQKDLNKLREELQELHDSLDVTDSEDREDGVAQLMEQLKKERQEKLGMQEDLDNLREELEELRDALDVIDSELTDQTNERSELEYELRNWISIAAQLEMQATGSQAMRKELELSLLEQAEVEEMLKLDTEEKDRRISNLEQQIFLMDQEIRIEEGDTTEEDEKVSPGLQLEEGDTTEEDEKVSPRLQLEEGDTTEEDEKVSPRMQLKEDDTTEEDEKVSPRVQMDDEQLQLELLTGELEEAIVGHIMWERNYTFDQIYQEDMGHAQKHKRIVQGFDDDKTRMDLEVCGSKENASQQHSHARKTSESFVEERSPFRELNYEVI